MKLHQIKAGLKQTVRNILRPVLYYSYYLPFQNSISVTRDGKPLLPGITAIVAARDEEYTIGMCLQSLVGIADQVVCIDNGSADATLRIMKEFREKNRNKIEIDILEMPGALLGDCREAGLQHTRHQWHLRWDADMVCKTSGPEDMKQLRDKVLKDNLPRAIQLPRTNLMGDLHHTYSNPNIIVDPGEPILVRFGKDIYYKEYGKFDSIKVPLYYRQEKENKRYYFHLSGLKSANNLLHRWFYFEWRDSVNKYKSRGVDAPPEIGDYEKFKIKFASERLNTSEPMSVQFRFLRQFASQLQKYDATKYGEYPEVVLQKEKEETQRFEVIYKDGKPYIRHDKHDASFVNYQPTADDLAWSPEEYHRKAKEIYRY